MKKKKGKKRLKESELEDSNKQCHILEIQTSKGSAEAENTLQEINGTDFDETQLIFCSW